MTHNIRKYKPIISVLLLILMASMIVPFSTFGVASAADEPTMLTRKWTGYVAGGGEDLLIANILDSSPGMEIIHVGGGVQPSSGAGRVSVLRASDGARILTTTHEGIGDTCQAQMADIDNDGKLEIIVPLQQPAGMVIYNSEDLSILWEAPSTYSGDPGYFNNPTGGRIDSSPVIGDIDGNGYLDIFVGIMAWENSPNAGSIRHLEYDPDYNDNFPGAGGIRQVDSRVVWHPCAGGLSLADTDNDGTWELYMADRSQGGMVDGSWGRGLRSFWAENLSSRWDVYDNMMSSNIPMLADVNKDGILDVVATDLSRAVLVLDSATGQPLVNDDDVTLSSSPSQRRNHYQSSVYDVDGDGHLEIMSADGWESYSSIMTIWDLWDWDYDAIIDTAATAASLGYTAVQSWKGPTVGEVTGDGQMDVIVTCFDSQNAKDGAHGPYGMVQVYGYDDVSGEFVLEAYTANNLVHRAIESVVQDVDGDGVNELFVLTQGGQVYCYYTNGIASNPLPRTEVQFYGERRNGASVYVPYEYDEPALPDSRAGIKFPSPSHWEYGVSTGLTSLEFTLQHPLNELMDYQVSYWKISDPATILGSDSVTGTGNGVKTFSVSGLQSSTAYGWKIEVTDASGHISTKEYAFSTSDTAPTQGTPTITGGSELENLVAHASPLPDVDGDAVTYAYRWTKDGVNTANLIMPFDNMTDPQAEYSGHAYTTDYSGYSNDGDVFGASWTDEGKVGGAYSLDGSNDFIRIEEQGNSLGGDGSWDSIAIEFWVKATSATSTRASPLLEKHGRPYGTDLVTNPVYQYTGYRVDFSASTTSDTITWRVYTENPADEENPIQYQVSANIGARADWHHVVCTYTSGDGLKIYADGVQINAVVGLSGNILQTDVTPQSSGNLGTRVGDWGHTTGGTVYNTKGPLDIAFGGMLDNLKIYPGEISADQVNLNYLDSKDGASSQSTISKYATSPGEVWRCYVTPNDASADGTTAQTSTVTIINVVNTPPVASNLAITPVSAVTGDDLTATYTYFDADGHPEFNSIITWYKNGAPSGIVGPVLLSSDTAKGDSWTFTVTPYDGFDYGLTAGPSDPVVIGNTAPSFESVVISPDPALDPARVGAYTLTANSYGFADPDADAVEGYTYLWQKWVTDDWQDIGGATSQTLDSSQFVKGETVRVLVTVNDGSEDGNTIEARKWIVDSLPPTTDTPSLVSSSGLNHDDDDLTCSAVNTQDPDVGESPISIYNWLIGGNPFAYLNLPFETNSSTTAMDYSGKGNDGDVYGATWTNNGVLGGAYSFDGNDYIEVPEQGNSLGGDGSWSALSVEFWIKPSGLDTGTQTVVAKTLSSYVPGGSVDASYRVQYRYYSYPDRLRVYFYLNDQSLNVNIYNMGNLDWHHIVCTYESGVGLRIYFDGLLQATLAYTGNVVDSTGGLLYLGGVNSGSGDFNGMMDEVKIYPIALSAAQIFQNYADSADGVDDSVTIVPQETSVGQVWSCEVTPNDGWQNGDTELSNTLTIVTGNTVPHIDWYGPLTSTPHVYVGDSLDFSVLVSDPNASPLTYKWFLDDVEQAGETTGNWTYSPLSASMHDVRVEVSDGSTTVTHEWSVDVEIQEYTITVDIVGTGNVVIAPPTGPYAYGTLVTLTPTMTDPDWHFVGWTGDIESSDDPLMITITEDLSITATFSNENVLTVNTVGNGHVDLDPAGGAYASGTSVTLTAVPDDGWEFKSWSGALTGDTNPETIVMDDHKTVTATFEQIEYVLTANSDIGGSILRNPNQATYHYGDEVELTAAPDELYFFEGWSGAASGNENPTTITIYGDTIVSAEFELAPIHLFSDGFESGDFSMWAGTGTEGSATTPIVTTNNPHAGTYCGQFAIAAGSGTRRSYSIVNIDSLSEVYASAYVYIPSSLSLASGEKFFAIRINNAAGALASYGVIADGSGMHWAVQYAGYPSALGTSAPTGGAWYLLQAHLVRTDTDVTLTLTVNDVEVATLNYVVAATPATSVWFGSAYYTGAGALTVNVDDATVDEQLTAEMYTLTIDTVGNGHVDLNPDMTLYPEGTEIELTAVADPGWTFSGWSGDASGTDLTTSVIVGDGNKAVTATFTQNEYTLTININPSSAAGTVTPNNPGPYHYNDIVILTPSANTGYTFSGWTGAGTNGAGNTREVTITDNMEVTATFTADNNVALSGWVVVPSLTNAGYTLDSSASLLSLDLSAVDTSSRVTVKQSAGPTLSLGDYSSLDVSVTGDANARILLRFFMTDGSSFDVVYWKDAATLDALNFDLTPYAAKTLRGDVYLAVMSSDGSPAGIDITEIAFVA